MRFDGYAASISGPDFMSVSHDLARELGACLEQGSPMRRYGLTLQLVEGGRQVAWIGEDKANGLVYVEGKGETSPAFVESVRRLYPKHQAPRLDVCEDYDDPQAFEVLQAMVREYKGPRVWGGYVALPDNPQDGRTWAAGKRGGVAYIRLYEAGKMKDRLHHGRPNWARLEVEARPHYADQKAAAATMQPHEVWGLAAWTHRVGEAVTGTGLPRYEAAVRHYTRHKTTEYLARTFRRHWEWMLEAEAGDQAAVIQRLMEVWSEDDEVAAKLAAVSRSKGTLQ